MQVALIRTSIGSPQHCLVQATKENIVTNLHTAGWARTHKWQAVKRTACTLGLSLICWRD